MGDEDPKPKAAAKPVDPSARIWKPALIGILFFSTLLRLGGLATPEGLVFDEAHHSKAAAVIVGVKSHYGMGAWADDPIVGRSPDPSFVHPPLGKFLIGAGILAFGDTGFGRRISSAVFGLLSLVLFFLIALHLLGSPGQATVAVALLAADGLHIVQSRTGMLDMFLFTFGLLGILGLLKMLQEPEKVRWRLLAGVAWGLALAVKLNTVLGALGCMILWLWLSPLPLATRFLALGQVIAPAAVLTVGIDSIYYMCNDYSLVEWFKLRTTASTALAGTFEDHQYGSYPGEWLWNKKPIWYAFERTATGTTGIVALGNPVVWLAFLPASYLVFAALRERWSRRAWDPVAKEEFKRDLIPAVWFLATYLPLHLVLWRREGFLYYMLPTVAPMCLVITRALFQTRPSERRTVIGVYLALVAAALLALTPVLVGATVPERYFTILFKFISA